jgi:hypothetical protein
LLPASPWSKNDPQQPFATPQKMVIIEGKANVRPAAINKPDLLEHDRRARINSIKRRQFKRQL